MDLEKLHFYKMQMKAYCSQVAGITDTEWARFFHDNLKVRIFKKGDNLCEAGIVENYISFVIKGAFRGYILKKEGIEKCYQFAFENQFVSSYYSFLTQQPSQVFIEALEPSLVLSFTYNTLQNAYSKSKSAERLGRVSAEWLFKIKEEREVAFLTKTAKELYLDLLEHNPTYVQRIPQYHIASYLGITPEHLARIKGSL